MKTLKQNHEFTCTPADLFDALTQPEAVIAWSGGPAEAGNQEGDAFSIWGGSVYGKNLRVDPNSRLVQEWVINNWNPPSKVTFDLIPHDGGTTLKLTQINIPDGEYADIEQGWIDNYYEPIARYLTNLA